MLLHRRHDAQIALHAPIVVVTNETLNHVNKSLLAGEPLTIVALTLQNAPESLHWSVIDVLSLASKVKSGPDAPDGLLSMFATFLESNGKAFPRRTVTIRMNDGR